MHKKDKEQQYVDKPFFSVKEKSVNNESDLNINAVIATVIPSLDEHECVTFEYDEKLKEKEGRHHIDFELENEGKNMAMDFYVALCEQKYNAIFPLKDLNSWVKSHFVNYSIYNKQSIIKNGKKIKIRINFLKETENQVHNLLLLYMDSYGNLWEQLFNPFECSLERPHLIKPIYYHFLLSKKLSI